MIFYKVAYSFKCSHGKKDTWILVSTNM